MALPNLLQEIVLFILFVNVGIVLVNQTEVAPGIWLTTGQVRFTGLDGSFIGFSDMIYDFQIGLYNGINNILLNLKANSCPMGLCFLSFASDLWNMALNLVSISVNLTILSLNASKIMVDVIINCTIGAPQFYANLLSVFGDAALANQYGLILGSIQAILMIVGFLDYIKGFI